MIISKYIVYFIIFSFLGWVWETIYCTFMNKKWESRGFLFGPVCPIYGVGAVGGFLLVDLLKYNNFPPLSWWQIVLISFFGSAVLEYTTSLILEKLFHAYWWDYSEMPFNINGRICLPASIGFTIAGFLVIYGAYPLFNYFSSFISPIVFEIIAVVFIIVITIDITLTISALTDIQNKVSSIDDSINDYMSEFVDDLYQNSTDLSKKVISRVRGVKFSKPTQTKIYMNLIEKIRRK